MTKPKLISSWIVGHLSDDPNAVKQVVVASTTERLSDDLAEELRCSVSQLGRTELVNLTIVLSGLTIWVPHHLALAEAVVVRADAVDAAEEVLTYLRSGMTLSIWGSSGGVSAELDSGRAACSSASEAAAHPRAANGAI